MIGDLGAWDAHAHVIGDPAAFPFWPGRSYTPEPAPLEAYLAMLDRYGFARGVLVQPSVYGFDNRCLIDALDRADGRLFGIVVPSPDASARDLERMHRHGVRGVRCNLINPGGLGLDVAIGWQPVLQALGWHVELHIALGDLADLANLCTRIAVPVIVDHMGRPAPGQIDVASPAMRTLIALVRDGMCYVKLSAPYRLSAQPPPWRDVMPLAEAFTQANPHACLWGSDWPHVDTDSRIQTSDVVDALSAWVPDAATRRIVTTHATHSLFARPPV
jgi:predicted TIM-barrel fold metal-dependent hydrolase